MPGPLSLFSQCFSSRMQSDPPSSPSPPSPPSLQPRNATYARFNAEATPQLQKPQSISATPHQLVSAIKTRHEVLERYFKAGGTVSWAGEEFLKRSATLSRHANASRSRESLQSFDRESASMLKTMRLRADEFDGTVTAEGNAYEEPCSTPGSAPLVRNVLFCMEMYWPPKTDSRKLGALLDIALKADMDDPTIYETLMASFAGVRDLYNEGRRRVGESIISD